MEQNRGKILADRAKAIGLSPTDWAAEAGVARSTIFHILRGAGSKGPHVGTLDRLGRVLEQRERAVLQHLVDLHGIPTKEQAA
ncbi:hypothetical protein AC629_42300 [Bradyrhizobium sp. NAS80.1]|uniref:helix-turn-helix domain-containing protein n=1 Tax=Bradyrhizobium sp. NAS80.1 TaxID=1680159 RepID=UPI0009668B21|nr:helix-turn-helix transcriptional regulator [Bradyrhizobium sp. NAS80.1]OKO68205.1 hypothetical protein AC629_42300 [Bradyrhizobium sp. NAS80.1]